MSRNGKGDRYRKLDPRKWSEGWERVWGKKQPPATDPKKEPRRADQLARPDRP